MTSVYRGKMENSQETVIVTRQWRKKAVGALKRQVVQTARYLPGPRTWYRTERRLYARARRELSDGLGLVDGWTPPFPSPLPTMAFDDRIDQHPPPLPPLPFPLPPFSLPPTSRFPHASGIYTPFQLSRYFESLTTIFCRTRQQSAVIRLCHLVFGESLSRLKIVIYSPLSEP